MKLRLHHPKLLAVVLLAIAAVTAAGILFASGGDDKEITFTPIPVEESLPTVSDEELAEAILIAKKSGVIEEINGGQEWTHDLVFAEKINGVEVVSFDATWGTPVESSGPWVLYWCKSTRELTTFARWTNITRLVVTVDIENDEVIQYAPMGHDGKEPVLDVGSHGGKEAKVRDVASGDIVFKGTKDGLSSFNMCPPGKEDEVGK